MWEDFKNIIWNSLRRWRLIWPLIAFYARLRRNGRKFFNSRPLLAFLAASTIALISVLYSCDLQPKLACREIDVSANNLYNENGDNPPPGEDRPCNDDKLVGVEFYNYSRTSVERNSPRYEMVSSGVFFRENVIGNRQSQQWHEFTLFKRANNFLWNPINQGGYVNEAFGINNCAIDPTDLANRDKRLTSQGIILRSSEQRAYRKLAYDKWINCNYGTADDQNFAECKYYYIEMFIPLIDLKKVCSKNKAKYYLSLSKTRRLPLMGAENNNELRILARDRWSMEKATNVPEAQWTRLTGKLPRICMRWVGKDGEKYGELSRWEDFASISAAWCDQ